MKYAFVWHSVGAQRLVAATDAAGAQEQRCEGQADLGVEGREGGARGLSHLGANPKSGNRAPPAPVQRAGTSWPSKLLEFVLMFSFYSGKSRKGGPTPFSLPGWKHFSPPDCPACNENHTTLKKAEVWAGGELGRKTEVAPRGAQNREPWSSASIFPWALGAAHLLHDAGQALQVLQSTLDIPHALLQRPNCPHQPRVQFLGPQRAALCRAQTHREGDSGGNSARDRVVTGWGRSGQK